MSVAAELYETEQDVSFLELQDLALLIFYKAAKGEASLPEGPTTDRICYRVLHQSDFMSARAVEGLQNKKLITSFNVLSPEEITARGIERVERLLRDQASLVAKTSISSSVRVFREPLPENKWRFSSEAKEQFVVALESVPASDRFVTLNHNSEQFQAATSALDDVITELDQTNNLGDVTPAEKEHFKTILVAGRKLLDEGSLRLSVVTSSLLPALNWLKTNLSEISVGTFAGVAAAAIAKLLNLV